MPVAHAHDMTRPTALLAATVLASCAADSATVCDEAERLAIDCAGASADFDFGDCSGDNRTAAEQVVEAGCDGLRDGKSDILSQLCLGPLSNFFPWCDAAEIRCEPTADDLDASMCNGSAALCNRPFDEVVFATSHNAFSAASMGFLRPNQSKRMYVQLRDGMRALMIDTRMNDGDLELCHISCDLGSTPILEGLSEIRDFLECHPNEVLAVIIEPHAPGIDHVRAIESAGLDAFVYTHTPGQPWPTLGEMIDRGTRLVVLAEKPGVGTPDWYHHQWDLGFDNEFSVSRVEDFACNLERGDPSNALFGLNHFVTVIGGDEFLALEPNRATNLHAHVEQCRDHFGRLPTFLAVDFHDIGDVVPVVRELNER